MHSLLLLDMSASAYGDRIAVQFGAAKLSYSELLAAAWQVPEVLGSATALVHLAPNSLAFPIAVFGAAAADLPCIPLNYRLSDDQLDALLANHRGALIVADIGVASRLSDHGHRVMTTDDFVAVTTGGGDAGFSASDGEEIWLLLYTSGTTAAPKAAILRHRHLTSYVVGSVEFASAAETEAVLVSVPPYHIAGVANLLSNLYLGRRIVYLDRFDADGWIDAVRTEAITHAMVVPTMLARLCDALEHGDQAGLPSLVALSYGGSRTPVTVVERIMRLLPDVGLTNAYGLTETSSTIAVLGPDDHRAAFADTDPAVRSRLSSAGRVLPGVEVGIRCDDQWLAPGEVGDIWVRGDQVSGEYAGLASRVDSSGVDSSGVDSSGVDQEGWFPTRDRGHLDGDGYLFVEGRTDDTIIRGGENIAPAEIEELLRRHPAVAEVAVVGVADDEWGQRIAAVIVCRPDTAPTAVEIRDFARQRLRGSKTPDVIAFVDELPYTETGKLLRRTVLADLTQTRRSDGIEQPDEVKQPD